MKIGVVSDTHSKAPTPYLENLVSKIFQDVDVIMHAGDIVTLETLSLFQEKELHAVSGNMDSDEIKNILPTKKVLHLEGVKIGLIHGWGRPEGMEDQIIREFDNIDCLVYGHTHNPFNNRINGVLFFNPGSPTDKRFAPYNSVGMLEVNNGKIQGQILDLR